MASPQIPKTMNGILIEKTGGVEVLEYKTDLPVPSPKDNEVLVKNEVSGVNFIGELKGCSPTILSTILPTNPINPLWNRHIFPHRPLSG